MDGFVLVVGMIQVVNENYINMVINAFGHKLIDYESNRSKEKVV